MENWRYRCQSITIEDNTNSCILETLQFSKIGWKGAAPYRKSIQKVRMYYSVVEKEKDGFREKKHSLFKIPTALAIFTSICLILVLNSTCFLFFKAYVF